MLSKKILFQEILNSFHFLEDIDYHPSIFEDRDFVIMYRSLKRRRKILIEIGFEIRCRIFRTPLFLGNPANPKNIIIVNEIFKNDDEFKALDILLTEDNWREVIYSYSKFIEKKLYPILDGSKWL